MTNPYEELRRLRDELAEVVNYLQAGGTLTRGGYHALQLQRLHRESRPAALAPVEEREEYWQNWACGWAFDAGRYSAYVDGSWAVLLDMMLERGGEVGDDARLLAQHLGIELRESYDGGKTWHPLRRLSFLRDMSTDTLVAELTRRGWFGNQAALDEGLLRALRTSGPPIDGPMWDHVCNDATLTRLERDQCPWCMQARPD